MVVLSHNHLVPASRHFVPIRDSFSGAAGIMVWGIDPMPAAFRTALIALLLASPAGGQQVASIFGRVTDRATGSPVVRAQLILLDDDRVVFTDSLGIYELRAIQPGYTQVQVKAIGFPPTTFVVEIARGTRVQRPVILDSTAASRGAQELGAVDVVAEARVNYRLADFERRRKRGRGQFLTEEQLVRSGAYSVPDALKNMRGVLYECGGGKGCFIRMTRAPMRCMPEYVVDGHVMNDFGPLTPIRDVVGVEMYNGPAEVPGEFAGRNSGCGVIVIWTRSGPDRRPAPRNPPPGN